jgi:hypothetical protein
MCSYRSRAFSGAINGRLRETAHTALGWWRRLIGALRLADRADQIELPLDLAGAFVAQARAEDRKWTRPDLGLLTCLEGCRLVAKCHRPDFACTPISTIEQMVVSAANHAVDMA